MILLHNIILYLFPDIILCYCKYNRSEVFVWALTETNLTEGTAFIRQEVGP